MPGITRVTIYKHGMAYFERLEEVEGNAEVRLTFRSQDMNDVLKSLTLHDLDGGTIQSVSYDTLKPVSKTLEEVALEIPSEGGTAALLSGIRGARVQLKVGSEVREGQVIGGEDRERRSGDTTLRTTQLCLYDASGALHDVDLSEVHKVTFLDEHIKKDLAFHLDTLIHSYRRDAKSLIVHAHGEGKRRIQLTYLLECPVWKTSYRASLVGSPVLTDALGKKEKPFLEGWALVDNSQDEDWVNVALSLISGLPISFRHDLYTPRYLHRKEVVVEQEAASGPVHSESAMPGAADPFAVSYGGADPFSAGGADPFASSADPFGSAADPFGSSSDPFASPAVKKASAQRAAGQVVTQSLGDFFEYTVKQPVTVNRNQSALVPILADELGGRRIVLYNRASREQNPFAAIELVNSTGLTLEAGPLMVFEGDRYAGEAMLDSLKPDDTQILAYAVDLGVTVENSHKNGAEEVTLVTAAAGQLTIHTARLETRIFRLFNKDSRDKVCLLETPIAPGATLHRSPEPRETTASFYRFEVTLPQKQTTELHVCLRTELASSRQISTIDRGTLVQYQRSGFLSGEHQPLFDRIVTGLEELHKLYEKHQESQNQSTAIAQEQARLRTNLQSLGSSTDEAQLRSRYVASMSQQENEMDRLRELLKELNLDIYAKQSELQELVKGVSFEFRPGGA